MINRAYPVTLPSLDDLKLNSPDYLVRYGFTEAELDTAQEITKRFYRRLDLACPQPGDKIVIENFRGESLRDNAIIEAIDTDNNKAVSICEKINPYVPFVFTEESIVDHSTFLRFEVNGGPWTTCSLSDLSQLSKFSIQRFKTWGRFGPTGHGAIYFDCPVRTWKLLKSN